ncbi:MAG TPA: 2-C-methyl-D-erythritol 2,4-cyclodiphosphate synthase [Candidatus Saccharimonadales bacterium]|nr:2-C-methyl-D-erythritol 2,4-cyclodiphosphate synthase [Candidatus Saccharimonadales bacterium]
MNERLERVGLGYDAHPVAAGRPLVLGGVRIESDWGLDGHSDADVIAHAIGDALLGAAGLGDLGMHFPPGEPRWKDASSLTLLHEIVHLVRGRGFRIGNVDATLLAERPRLDPHREAMREKLAATLGIPADRVSVKATTNEGMGFVGRQEGLAALAVARIVQGD